VYSRSKPPRFPRRNSFSGSSKVGDDAARQENEFEIRQVSRRVPNLATYADSMQTPPRALVEIDADARDPRTFANKTTRYVPHEQRAEIRFLYDRFPDDEGVNRYVSDGS
jgi:hypothetical protein